jgi:polar amino acid transport system substrate-binding protein
LTTDLTQPDMQRIHRTVRGILCIAAGISTFIALLFSAQPARSQTATAPLRVVIKPLAPFVQFEGDKNTGFSIDLWEEITRRLGRETQFVRVDTVVQQLEAVERNTADIAITGISITHDRETRIDFSLPYFDAGLQIMTATGSSTPSLFSLLGTFFSANVLQIVLIVFTFVVGVALIFWFVERRNKSEHFPEGLLAGFGEALWWACVTVVTVGYGDRVPRSFWGRVVAVFWMFIGLFLISNFTATITSELTLRQLQGTIRSIDDLANKRVLTVTGSTADRYLTAQGIRHSSVLKVEDGFTQLAAGQTDAVVYDAPVLRNFVLNGGAGKVRMVGSIFNHEAYGIAFQQGSPLREDVNRVLLTIREDGTYARIYNRWFGEER